MFGVQTLDDGAALLADLDRARPRRAVVVGGGYIGVEMAEALVRLGPLDDLDAAELLSEVTGGQLGPDARARLLGEWLRRQRCRREARDQLGPASDAFADRGVQGFAERARTELEATGGHARVRRPETSLARGRSPLHTRVVEASCLPLMLTRTRSPPRRAAAAGSAQARFRC